MTLKWIEHPTPTASHKLFQLLVDEGSSVVATVERFSETMPTYANVYAPVRERRPVSLYDFKQKIIPPGVAAQDQVAREWCERTTRPN